MTGNENQIQHWSESEITQAQNQYLSKVYGWMTGGLALTGLVAWYVYSSGLYIDIFMNSILYYALLFAPLILVMVLSARVEKMSLPAVMASFLVYAAANGITFSMIFAIYSLGSIAGVFAITAGMFAVMSAIGYFIKSDLSGMGRFMMMGVIGIVIASIVNIFLGSSVLNTTISIIGVIAFAGLTAYDTQKLKEMYALQFENGDLAAKYAVMGALSLYLDFINMFLFLLRLFGGSRD